MSETTNTDPATALLVHGASGSCPRNRNVGEGKVAELATYVVEKDKPLFNLAE
jgi:hypothetical protein